MKFGALEVSNPVGLAPMAGVTDRPFRQLCKRLGAGFAPSEMVTADQRLWHTEKSRRRMDHRGEPGPVIVQIAGPDPDMLAKAAQANVDHGAQAIDINLGCPAKKVCKRLAGSALLSDEALVGKIFERVVAAVSVPVTAKIRTGPDPEQRNAVRIARLAEAAGIQALAVHGRTRRDMYRGEAEYATIRQVCEAVRIPVLANGDIDSPEKAEQVMAFTGADGILVGRAAQGRPWIFREIRSWLERGEHTPPPDDGELLEIMSEHLENLYSFYGEHTGVRIARKHLGWYAATREDGGEFRREVMPIESAKEQLAQTRRWLGWGAQWREVAAA